MKTLDYVYKLVESVPYRVRAYYTTVGGFRYNTISFGDAITAEIFIPDRFKKATYSVRKSIRHEFGHSILIYLIIKDNIEAKRRISSIPKWFKLLQHVWYWNKILRSIRIKLGFSNRLWYGPNELYHGYYRWEHELFADWSAVGRWKGLNDYGK